MAVADEPLLLLDRRLRAWRRSRPESDPALDFEARLLRQRLSMPRAVETQPFALPREHLVARVREGVPLLHDQPVHLDVRFAFELFQRLLTVFEQAGGSVEAWSVVRSRVDGLSVARSSGQLDVERVFGEGFVRHADHLAEAALELGMDAGLLTDLARRATEPLLAAYAARLAPMLERLGDESPPVAVWKQGYCPVCGGWPAFGEQHPAEHLAAGRNAAEPKRRLRCAACGSGWWAPGLLTCVFCRNADPSLMRTPGSDPDEPRQRVAACDRCHRYLKVIEAVEASPPAVLRVDDVATRSLDAVANSSGYQRPSGSGFRIELAVPEDDWPDELVDG